MALLIWDHGHLEIGQPLGRLTAVETAKLELE
jgi:hypothetical protein